MADRVILTPPQDITFGSFMFDATTREVFKAASKVTNYPVEGGSQITDHVTQPPRELSLTGVVSATPLDESEGREMRLQDLFANLLALQLKEEPMEVCSTLGFIPSMLITMVTGTYAGADTGDMISLSVNLKTITISEAERVLIAQTRLEQEIREDWAKLKKELEAQAGADFRQQVFKAQVAEDKIRQATRRELNRTIFENPDLSPEQKKAHFIRLKSSPRMKGVIRKHEYIHSDGLKGDTDFGVC